MYQSEIKRTGFFLIFLPYELLAMAMSMMFVTAAGSYRSAGAVGAMLLLLGFCTGWMRLHALKPLRDVDEVDIWAHQEQLMDMSGQERPALPVFTKGSLLYLALQAEELSETYKHATEVMERARQESNATDEDRLMLQNLHTRIHNLYIVMHNGSEDMRGWIKELPDHWRTHLTYQQSKDLLDDVTDTTVVTAGFGLATGLPARSGYLNVATSNASKANPDTGVIDKMPDGKWIKGRDYQEPDLDSVLHEQLADNWHA